MSDTPVPMHQAARQIGISLSQLDLWVRRARIKLIPGPIWALPSSAVNEMTETFSKQVSKEELVGFLCLSSNWICHRLRQYKVQKFPYILHAYFDQEEVEAAFTAEGYAFPAGWRRSLPDRQPPEGLDSLDVADRLQCRRETVFSYLKRGELRGTKAYGRWWIDDDSVEELRKHLEAARKEAVNRQTEKRTREAKHQQVRKMEHTHLSRHEVATKLGISNQAVSMLVKNGRLPGIRVGNRHFIAKSELASYLKGKHVPDDNLSLMQVAEKLGVRQHLIFKGIHNGTIEAEKIDQKWYIKEEKLEVIKKRLAELESPDIPEGYRRLKSLAMEMQLPYQRVLKEIHGGRLPALKIQRCWYIQQKDLAAIKARFPIPEIPKGYLLLKPLITEQQLFYHSVLDAIHAGTLPAVKVQGCWYIKEADRQLLAAFPQRPASHRQLSKYPIPPASSGETLLSLAQAADYVQVNPQMISNWAQEGDLPCFKLGNIWRFKKADLDAWMDTPKKKE